MSTEDVRTLIYEFVDETAKDGSDPDHEALDRLLTRLIVVAKAEMPCYEWESCGDYDHWCADPDAVVRGAYPLRETCPVHQARNTWMMVTA